MAVTDTSAAPKPETSVPDDGFEADIERCNAFLLTAEDPDPGTNESCLNALQSLYASEQPVTGATKAPFMRMSTGITNPNFPGLVRLFNARERLTESNILTKFRKNVSQFEAKTVQNMERALKTVATFRGGWRADIKDAQLLIRSMTLAIMETCPEAVFRFLSNGNILIRPFDGFELEVQPADIAREVKSILLSKSMPRG